MSLKRSIRVDEDLILDIQKIAEEKNSSDNFIIEQALKFYRDYYFMKEKATFVNEDILNVLSANLNLAEIRINNKTNQVLSELAIGVSTLNQIIANSLDVDPIKLQSYRANAVDFIKTNQRIFKLDEIL